MSHQNSCPTSEIIPSRKLKPKFSFVLLLGFLVMACILLSLGTLKGQDPLQRYGEVSTLPMEKRRAEFGKASPKEKSDLFRTHLALYVAKHPELSNYQNQIILDGMALATPERYEVPTNSPDWKLKVEEPLKQFQGRVLASFSRDEGAKIFATMGQVDAQDDLLQKYREISQLPMGDRRAAFRNASAQDKSDFWRVHLALYVARHPELSEAQKVIISAGLSLVKPELFDVRFDSPDWSAKVAEPLKEFKNNILGVFTKEQAARVFATIGDANYPSDVPRVKPSTVSQVSSQLQGNQSSGDMFVLTRFAAKNTLPWADCGCNKSESYCGSSSHCGNDTCNTTQYGCGYFWLNTCNGGCIDDFLN
jgi:hypothetical protein